MATADSYDPTGIEYYDIPDFQFVSGASLNIRIAYRSFNPSASKAACVPTCYGGLINSTLNFSSGALSAHHVIVVAMLGNGESSSPSNTPEFPSKLDYRDVVRSQYELLTRHLGVKELDTVVGFSMGGQQAYYWPCMYPDFVKTSVVICGSARTSPHNHAFLEGPKGALINSTDYADGNYRANGVKPLRGLRAFGRAYSAWLTSGAWFRERLFETRMGYATVEDFIQGGAEASFSEWDAEDVLILARMWQAGDIGTTAKDGDYMTALAEIKARVLVMPARTDQYFLYVSLASSGSQMNVNANGHAV